MSINLSKAGLTGGGSEMIEAAQIRAARALLEWSQGDLVEKTGLSLTTIRRMEDSKIGPGRSSLENVAMVQKVLEAGGVKFMQTGETPNGGPGVRVFAPGISPEPTGIIPAES